MPRLTNGLEESEYRSSESVGLVQYSKITEGRINYNEETTWP